MGFYWKTLLALETEAAEILATSDALFDREDAGTKSVNDENELTRLGKRVRQILAAHPFLSNPEIEDLADAKAPLTGRFQLETLRLRGQHLIQQAKMLAEDSTVWNGVVDGRGKERRLRELDAEIHHIEKQVRRAEARALEPVKPYQPKVEPYVVSDAARDPVILNAERLKKQAEGTAEPEIEDEPVIGRGADIWGGAILPDADKATLRGKSPHAIADIVRQAHEATLSDANRVFKNTEGRWHCLLYDGTVSRPFETKAAAEAALAFSKKEMGR